ncbi:MOSC N-terminal beta barrel domain-containing protein [Streptomyces venezuelae]|uniref:MOSC N-terminal beta barrel domain-containing protein n=1 Tax=Streptomyces venezuelae TaxID=54571 RepID=UPI001CC2459E|nr:MOSC N-terminal beta barrel domain-containing protein [Streptomyces venezuelae]
MGVIERLWRYPVKSTGGERLQRVEVDERGLAGDRLFAVRDADGRFGSGKNTRRFRRMDGLLHLSSRYPQCPGAGSAGTARPAREGGGGPHGLPARLPRT